MSTHFLNVGNIGSAPEYHEFPNDDRGEPDCMLRVSVYFDHPIRVGEEFEDRGGFWAPVELRHRDARKWCSLYQKGMRVAVSGDQVSEKWVDAEENDRVTFKIRARWIAILPYRIESLTLMPKAAEASEAAADE
jgi:single-strand DNA-binding protein